MTTFYKMCNATHKLLVMRRCGEIAFHKNVKCDSQADGYRKRFDDVFHNSVQCHSLPVSHKRRSDETVFM